MGANFHAGNIATSKKLQRLRDLLLRAGECGMTAWEIIERAGIVNPAGACSELRANGYDVQTTFVGTNDNGRKIFRYVLKVEHRQMEML